MFLLSVGEEDEVSIRDIAYMVVEAMDFKGEVVVSCDLQIWVKNHGHFQLPYPSPLAVKAKWDLETAVHI